VQLNLKAGFTFLEMLFEVNARKVWSRGAVKRIKGKDVWGTEEIKR